MSRSARLTSIRVALDRAATSNLNSTGLVTDPTLDDERRVQGCLVPDPVAKCDRPDESDNNRR